MVSGTLALFHSVPIFDFVLAERRLYLDDQRAARDPQNASSLIITGSEYVSTTVYTQYRCLVRQTVGGS